MADIRIKDITTLASASLTGDVFVIDGTTGARKLSAFSPTFGGNATVTGTLTVNGGTTLNATLVVNSNVGTIGKSGTGTGGNWRFVSDDGTTRWLSGILGGAGETSFSIYDIANSRSLLTATAAGVVQINQTTASTTTSSGALVVGNGTSGGLGVGGAINAGGTITSTNGSGSGLLGMRSSSGNASYVFWSETGVADRGILGFNNGSSTLSYRSFSSSFSTGTEVFSISSAGNTTVAGTLTVNGAGPHAFAGAITINPSSGDVQQNFQRSGTGKGIISVPGTAGNIVADSAVDDFVVRTTSGKAFRVTTDGGSTSSLSVATATVSVLATTASTSTSSGALVVSGGMGIAKQIVAGGVISIDPLDASPEDLAPEVAFCRGVGLATTASVLAFGSGARIGLLRGYQDGGNLVEWRFGSYIGTTFNEQMRLGGTSATSSSLTLYGTTASTSTSSGALVVSGGVGVAGALYAANLGGTSTNNNAASGCIGEYTSATTAYASKVSLTSNTAANIVSISLTAGDWDVQFNPVFTQDTPLTTSGLLAGVSSSSATLPSGAAERAHSPSGPNGNSDISIAPPVTRISLASTTTIYGVATGIFSAGTMSAYGFIRARRVR